MVGRGTGVVPILVGLVVSALSLQANAADNCASLDSEVSRLLQAMSSNAEQIDYSGVVTLQRGGDMQIMELSHAVRNGRATEEIARLTGQDARVERSGHPTGCMHPGHQLLRSSELRGDSFCGLSASYRFRISAGERVAGREAVRLRAEPRDMYRFGYIFELDRETALMLKSSTLSVDQRVLEEFQFASLSMQSKQSADAAVQHAAAHPHPHETAHLRAGPHWSVAWLPKGFMATDSAPSDSQRKSYTDGLASFSVFLEPLSTSIKPGEGVERQGSTVAYTRGVLLQRKPVLVTVLGEIPTNTARMVADSVRLRR
ncbi:MAG: MucB/RseB C-terminal domain-containing protein [Congregibacter sp.]